MFNLVHNGTVLDVTQRVKVCKDVVLQAQEAAEPPPMTVGSVRVTLKEDASYVALIFTLDGSGGLQCALRLET